jgi:DNA-binding transcriptional MocR family regulator
VARRLQVPIVDDTTVAELALDAEPPPPVAAFDPGAPVFTVGSASKVFWGGLRVGWVRAPADVIVRLAQLKATSDLGSSVLSQHAAVHLLLRVDEARTARRQQLAPRRDALDSLLRRHLPSWTWRRPEGGLSLWARMPSGDARELAEVARSHGVVFAPGTAFTVGEVGRDRLRLVFSLPSSQLEVGIRRLAEAWTAYQVGARAGFARQAIV